MAEVMVEAEKVAMTMEQGSLIIQGGGNGMEEVGEDETVRCIVDGVKKIKEGRKGLRIAVVGVMRRPRESVRYEMARRRINKRVQNELGQLKARLMKEKDTGVSFIDTDQELDGRKFARDLVHLSGEGNKLLGARLSEWLKASRKVQTMWRKGLEAGEESVSE